MQLDQGVVFPVGVGSVNGHLNQKALCAMRAGADNTEVEVNDEDIHISGKFCSSYEPLAAGPRISLKMMIQIMMMMHWRINAEIALLKKVYFVTPQNWKCQQ